MSKDSELKEAEKEAARLTEHLLAIPSYLDVGTPEDPTTGRTFTQIIFLVNRQNYFSLLGSLAADHVIPAAHLARALLEESIRWEWMTDKPDPRMRHLFGELRQSLKAIGDECAALGVDPTPFTNPSPIGDTRTLQLEGPRGFPPVRRMLDEIQGAGRESAEAIGEQFSFQIRAALYAQYRILSQFTHTSILGMTATVQQERDGSMSIGTSLPLPVRALIVHTSASSITNIATYTAAPFFIDEGTQKFLSWLRDAREIIGRIGSHAGPLHGLTP